MPPGADISNFTVETMHNRIKAGIDVPEYAESLFLKINSMNPQSSQAEIQAARQRESTDTTGLPKVFFMNGEDTDGDGIPDKVRAVKVMQNGNILYKTGDK